MLMKFSKKLDTVLTHIEEWTLFIIVMAVLILLFANIVLQHGFHYTIAWSEELGCIAMIYITFVGTSLSIKKGAMIRIDALIQIVPKLKTGLRIYSNLLLLFFAWMMMHYGYKMTVFQYATGQSTSIMHIPLVLVYAVMPVSGAMVLIRTVQVLIQDIKANFEKSSWE